MTPVKTAISHLKKFQIDTDRKIIYRDINNSNDN